MTWQCKAGCKGDCCGPVPIPRATFEKHKDKINNYTLVEFGNEVLPDREGRTQCLFLGDDYKCMIYEDRPEVCKMYGVSLELPCPYVKPNGRLRSEAQVRRWERKINHNVDYQMNELKKRLDKNGTTIKM